MLPLLITIGGALLLGEILVAHWQLARAIRRRCPPPLDRPRGPDQVYPSVTVIRPVRGLDVGAEANFLAALDTGYPGEVETLFLFDDAADPALEVARIAVAAHTAQGRPGAARVLVIGPPPAGRTGKLNAMIFGAATATGELIAFGDSDTRPDRDVLRELVETLIASPRAGSAFAPVVVSGPARTAGDVGYALLINAFYGPAAAQLAARDGSVPFIMGQLMVLRREALDAIGGLVCAEGQLVDDMHIGACIHRAGWRNLMCRRPLQITVGDMDAAQFVALFHRWILFARNGLPVSFTWPQWRRGLEFWLALLIGGAALVSGHPLAVALPAASTAAFGASVLRLQRVFGGGSLPTRYLWMPFAMLLFSPVIFVGGLLRRQVRWRGRTYVLDAGASLAQERS